MNLIKIIIEIRYKEVPSSFDFRKKIFEAIIEKPPEELPPIKEGLVINVKEKKMRVMVESNRAGADLEYIENVDKAVEILSKLFAALNGKINWGKINRLGIRTLWAKSTTKPLAKLVKKFKTKFYAENNLLKKSTDIDVFFTLVDDDNKINYSSGPIEREQLKNNFVFKDVGLPKRSILVDVDYYTNKEFIYSDVYLNNFLSKAINYGRDIAKETVKILGV